jgi:hypothetical protein
MLNQRNEQGILGTATYQTALPKSPIEEQQRGRRQPTGGSKAAAAARTPLSFPVSVPASLTRFI